MNKKILITAFEPFGDIKTNSSYEILKLLKKDKNDSICCKLLPTSYNRARREIINLIQKESPDYIIALGQATGEKSIRVEKLAINYTRASIPDNDNDFRTSGKISDGENAYFSKINVEDLVDYLNANEIPTYLSISSGSYVCNLTYYTILENFNKKAVFIHLPLYVGQLNTNQYPSLDIETLLRSIKLAINYMINKE